MDMQGKFWGKTTPIFRTNHTESHLIFCKKGGYCSRHLHRFKHNKFVVVTGKLQIEIWRGERPDITVLEACQELTVEPGVDHRFTCMEEDTIAIEFYWTDSIDPADIERRDRGGMLGDG